MARDFAKKFYHSKAWKNTRNAYMKAVVMIDGKPCPPGMCESHFARNGVLKPAEIVHHKTHLSPENIMDRAISLGFDNLERLCRQCHADEHPEIYGECHGPRVLFDENGNVMPR